MNNRRMSKLIDAELCEGVIGMPQARIKRYEDLLDR